MNSRSLSYVDNDRLFMLLRLHTPDQMAAFYEARGFTPAAIERIHRASGGIPRLINLLCHKSMLAVMSEGAYRAGRRHVGRALGDTEGARRWRTLPFFGRSTSRPSQRSGWRSLDG